MQDIEQVDFFDFTERYSTYWGRRRLGIVVDSDIANQRRSDVATMSTFYAYWRTALDAYPGEANLHLMGTPALDVEVVRRWSAATERPLPPPAPVVGRYAGEPGKRAEVGDEPTLLGATAQTSSKYRTIVNARFAMVAAVAAVGASQVGLPVVAIFAGVTAVMLVIRGDVAAFQLKVRPALLFRTVNWIAAAIAIAVVIIELLGQSNPAGI